MKPGKHKHPEFKVFVEGGGDHQPRLAGACKEGFGRFFERAELGGRKPRIVVCGSRQAAYDDFRHALQHVASGDSYLLLVDSEAPIAYASASDVWGHVKRRQGDGWDCPPAATPDDLHLMVECMENWFLADSAALKTYYGQHLNLNALPQQQDVESIGKATVYGALKKAIDGSGPKGEYSKGSHSFAVLALLDSKKIAAHAPFVCRLLEELRKRSGAKKMGCMPPEKTGKKKLDSSSA